MKRLVAIAALIVLVQGCDSYSRSDRPLTRARAASRIGLPLPTTARNVYFLEFAGGMQDLERYIRFDLDKADIDAAVEAIIKEANTVSLQSLPYTEKAISPSDFQYPRSEWMPVHWWNIKNIKNGYYRGEEASYAVRIWVDLDNSRIYAYQND